jgi:hypothetical protein
MITGALWYTGSHCIGIVQVVQGHQVEEYRQTGEAEFKYYIGVGLGQEEKSDAQYIADYGMPFDKVAGDSLFRVN